MLKLKAIITVPTKDQGENVLYSCMLEADSCFHSPSVPVWVLAVLVKVAFLWGLKRERSTVCKPNCAAPGHSL